MLAGIALVVDDLKHGPRLAYRWPPVRAEAAAEEEAEEGDREGGEEVVHDANLMARLLRARKGLEEGSYEVSVGSTWFVAAPVRVPRDTDGEGELLSGVGGTHGAAGGDEAFETDGLAPALFAEEHALEREASASEAPMRGRAPSLDSAPDAASGGVGGSGVSAGGSTMTLEAVSAGSRSVGALTVVLVVEFRRDVLGADGAVPVWLTSVRRAAESLAWALRSEEVRVGYVTDQLRRLGGVSGDRDPRHASSLVAELSFAMESLRRRGRVSVDVNGWLPLSLGPLHASLRGVRTGPRGVRATDSLVLLEPAAVAAASLPPDSPPSMRALLRVLSPAQGLLASCARVGIGAAEGAELAVELVRSGLAMWVETLTLATCLRCCPRPSPIPAPRLAAEFAAILHRHHHLPASASPAPAPAALQLPAFLALWAEAPTLQAVEHAVPPAARGPLLALVIWAVARRVLEPVYPAPLLTLPAPASAPSPPDLAAPLSREEEDALARFAAPTPGTPAAPPWALLRAVAPLFRGKASLAEASNLAGVRYADVEAVALWLEARGCAVILQLSPADLPFCGSMCVPFQPT